MPQLFPRRNRRRLRQGAKLSALILLIFATIHYFTGRTSLLPQTVHKTLPHPDHPHQPHHQPHHSPHHPPTPHQTADVFSKHFQTGFQFHTNQKTSETLQKEKKNSSSRGRNRPPQDPDDWPNFFVPRTQPQFSMNYPYTHRAILTCTPAVDALVMTLSHPENRLRRQAIRETWGSVVKTGAWPEDDSSSGQHSRQHQHPHRPHHRLVLLSERVRVVFLMGEDDSEETGQPEVSEVKEEEEEKEKEEKEEALRRESETYGDVVQWKGLRDSYYNLTMKVLLGLQWVTEYCPKVQHVIKTDDDTFVHVPRLLRLLTSHNTTNVIWGSVFTGSPCERSGRYAVSKEAYPFTFYPTHVKGNLYVLSWDVVNGLVMLAPYLPYNNMEDVHVTGTLARVLGIGHRSFSGREFSVVPQAPDGCLFEENRVCVGSQRVSPQLAFKMWGTFSGNGSCHLKKYN